MWMVATPSVRDTQRKASWLSKNEAPDRILVPNYWQYDLTKNMNNDKCPKCGSENIYEDGNLWVCPECSHEWNMHAQAAAEETVEASGVIKDSNGNILQDGDTVVVIKDLKIKGSSSVVKVGTKVKNIRLGDGGDGHDISCKIDGFGAMNLKSEFVRKA